AIVAAASKEPARRDAAAEQRIRDRLAAATKEREGLQKVFAAEFPDYAALSNPQPLIAEEIQSLMTEDEVLIAFAAAYKEYYVFALTRDAVTWKKLPLATAALTEKVSAFRRGLDTAELTNSAASGKRPELFDLGIAHELYDPLLGPVDDVVKDKPHLM